MAVNKVIYAGTTLLDLTADTVTESDVLEGAKFHKADGTTGTGTCTYDSDTSDATVHVAEMLKDKTAYARGDKLTGTMPNNGSVTGTIATKDDEYTIPQGYHDGSGKVSIESTEKAKLIPANIRSGVTVLGVEGSMSGSEDVKAQAKTVPPTNRTQTVLPDAGYNYLSQVTVEAIYYSESENSAGGTTVTIGTVEPM